MGRRHGEGQPGVRLGPCVAACRDARGERHGEGDGRESRGRPGLVATVAGAATWSGLPHPQPDPAQQSCRPGEEPGPVRGEHPRPRLGVQEVDGSAGREVRDLCRETQPRPEDQQHEAGHLEPPDPRTRHQPGGSPPADGQHAQGDPREQARSPGDDPTGRGTEGRGHGGFGAGQVRPRCAVSRSHREVDRATRHVRVEGEQPPRRQVLPVREIGREGDAHGVPAVGRGDLLEIPPFAPEVRDHERAVQHGHGLVEAEDDALGGGVRGRTLAG